MGPYFTPPQRPFTEIFSRCCHKKPSSINRCFATNTWPKNFQGFVISMNHLNPRGCLDHFFSSLNFRHLSFVTHHLSLITLKYHTRLAPSLISHHSIFFTLFVGPILVTQCSFFFYFFSFFLFQYPDHPNPVKEERKRKKKKKKKETQITLNPKKNNNKKKKNLETHLHRQFQTMASFNFVCHSINKPRKKHQTSNPVKDNEPRKKKKKKTTNPKKTHTQTNKQPIDSRSKFKPSFNIEFRPIQATHRTQTDSSNPPPFSPVSWFFFFFFFMGLRWGEKKN